MYKFLTATLLVFSINSGAAVLEQKEVPVVTKIKVIKLSAKAKCRAPRFEDDPFTVYYDNASYREIESYVGYSVKVLDRTCGEGGAKELSPDRFEDVEVLVYNYGQARREFDAQVTDAIDSL